MAVEPMIWRLLVINESPQWTLRVDNYDGNEWSQSTLATNNEIAPATQFSAATIHTVATSGMYNMLNCDIPNYASPSNWAVWMGGTRDGDYQFRVGWTGSSNPMNGPNPPSLQSFNKNVKTWALAPSANARVLVVVFQGTDFGQYQTNPPPAVSKDPALEVYFTVVGSILSEAASKDPDVATFANEFINQNMALKDTTYGKALMLQLQANATTLQQQIDTNSGDVNAEQQSLARVTEFEQGMDIEYSDVTLDEATEQFSIGKRAQVTEEDKWHTVPPIVKWALNPSIDVGGVKIPIPMAPMSRDVSCAVM